MPHGGESDSQWDNRGDGASGRDIAEYAKQQSALGSFDPSFVRFRERVLMLLENNSDIYAGGGREFGMPRPTNKDVAPSPVDDPELWRRSFKSKAELRAYEYLTGFVDELRTQSPALERLIRHFYDNPDVSPGEVELNRESEDANVTMLFAHDTAVDWLTKRFIEEDHLPYVRWPNEDYRNHKMREIMQKRIRRVMISYMNEDGFSRSPTTVVELTSSYFDGIMSKNALMKMYKEVKEGLAWR